MRGVVSFHPVSLEFFDGLVASLVAGRKVNPEPFVVDALRLRRIFWQTRGYLKALEEMAASVEAPRPSPGAGLLHSLRAKIEAFDHRPNPLAVLAARNVEADIHLHGRPFLIAEGSADKVAEVVEAYRRAGGPQAVDRLAREQIAKLDTKLGQELAPREEPPLSSELTFRADLLADLKAIHDLARGLGAAAPPSETSDGWETSPRATPASARPEEIPWRAVACHARIVPFWLARDVDGLETVCRASGVPSPDVLVPAWRLFPEAVEKLPSLKEALGLEIAGDRSVAAYVAPRDVPTLLDFLNTSGSKIIGAATRAGEGPACTALLRKIKECAVYAAGRRMGYLEASGIEPPDLREDARG